ncbi:MAG: M16 family metallopeptidase [Polyangia bacterium]
MRRLFMLAGFVLSCAHVPPASTENVPSPWPEARADAGNAPATTTPPTTKPPTTTPPTRPAPPPQQRPPLPVEKTPGGAVIKRGTPPPVVPLQQPAAPGPTSEAIDKTWRSQAPAGGPPPKLNLPVPARRKLKNGAAVLVVERHELPMASLVITWPTGIADEPPAQAGLAGLTADLLDEGAGTRGALEVAEEVARLGAQLQTTASWDDTRVQVTALTRALDALLPIVADVVARPAFADKELERVRADRVTSLAQLRDVPAVISRDTLARVVYGDKARYGVPELGSEATLRALGRADVVKWHAERLRPDVATIIVVGDVQTDDIVRRLDAAFVAWTSPQKGKLKHPPATPPKSARKVVIVDRPGAAQTEMRLGLPGAPRTSKDYFPCLVTNAILGGQFISRLNFNLREQHGYTYGARTEFSFRRDGGPFVAGAPVKTAVTEPSLKETLAELARIRDTNVEPAELELAKDLLGRALAREFETPPQVAAALVAQVVEGLPDNYYKTYAEHIAAVSVADVRKAAQRWIDPTRMAIVLVGDEAQIGAGVKTMVGAYERRGTDGAPVAKGGGESGSSAR